MSNDVTIYPLKHPITIGTETHTEVKIGRIKGKFMRALPADPKAYNLGTIMDLAAKVCGESGIVLDEMDAEDVLEVCGIVGERMTGGPMTGGSA